MTIKRELHTLELIADGGKFAGLLFLQQCVDKAV
jgi:hypothetical protein